MAESGRISVVVDPALGGRWTSLRSAAGREWLFSRTEPRRAQVTPGDRFVDAGGLEECLPTLGGPPDHGVVWSRPWTETGGGHEVEADGFRLRREMTADGDVLTVRYRLEGEPGRAFIWAAHALLDLPPGSRLVLPEGLPATVGTETGLRSFPWPDLDGVDLGDLGPDDGSTLMVVVPDVATAIVLDGLDRLTLTVSAPGLPTGVAFWRNLGGWPEDAPYRSIGVEPLLGRTGDLGECGSGDAVTIPESGVVTWTLTITADRP
ncbi:hypothetical protein ABGB18_45400 [Nonomuraea sp. B12E4]|uniref:hypothetical protein n=1 Tax=Nonomuraea sp. B12E4 TaxID=3153564 RepID=UPI00325E9114